MPSHFPQNALTNKKFAKAFREVYQEKLIAIKLTLYLFL